MSNNNVKVQILTQTYLNDRYLARKSHDEYLDSVENPASAMATAQKNAPLLKHVDLESFTPVAFSGVGTTMVRTLRKVILDEVPVFAVKTSMDLANYEQADKSGNSYLHDSYSKYYRVQEKLDVFQNDSKHQEYQNKSGFAKVVVVNEEGKRVYNGDEHTQVLTDRWGFLPIDSNLSYHLDTTRTPPVRVPLDQIWFFVGQVKGNSGSLRSLDQIKAIEFTNTDSNSNRILHLTVSNSLLAFYYDFEDTVNGSAQSQPVWHNITSQVIPNYGADGTAMSGNGGLFPYNTLLLSLKPGQRVLAHCRVEEGMGRRYAKWMPGIIRYKFATARDLSPGAQFTNPETNDEQREYLVASGRDPLLEHVFAHEPETIILTLQSVGRLKVPAMLDRALANIRVWLSGFRNGLLDLSRFYNIQRDHLKSFIAEPLIVRVDNYSYPELILQVDNCHGSYLPLIVDSFLRSLVKDVSTGLATDSARKAALSRLEEVLEHHRRYQIQEATLDSTFTRDDRDVVPPLNDIEKEIVREVEQWNRNKQKEVNDLVNDHLVDRSIRQAKLLEYRLQHGKFEDEWLDKQGLPLPMPSEQMQQLLEMLEKTIISQRVRHPLRTESYLTLKYPDSLLKQIGETELKRYFYQGEYGDLTDENLVNFYRILTITLQYLDELDKKIDHLSLLINNAFMSAQSKVDPNLFKSRHDYEYRTFLQQKIVTQYTESTKLTLPYYEEQLHSGTPVRGQRKLFLTEVFFLSKFLTPETEKDYIVVYAGAADGSHQIQLHKMFPNLKFVLFDPAFSTVYEKYQKDQSDRDAKIFTLGKSKLILYNPTNFGGNVERPQLQENLNFNSPHSYYIFPCYCTPQIVSDLARMSGQRKILFISDLRVIPSRQDTTGKKIDDESYQREVQRQVYKDNYIQYQLVKRFNESGKLEAAMIKFRFPYKDAIPYIKLEPLNPGKNDGEQFQANQFYRGEVYIQPYAPGSTTESRLIIGQDVLKSKEPLTIYDDVKYEQFFSYVNNVVRRSMKFWTPQLSRHWNRKHDLNEKYDHLLELLILNSYIVKYHQAKIVQGQKQPLDLLAELLEEVESDPTMQSIKWKDTV